MNSLIYFRAQLLVSSSFIELVVDVTLLLVLSGDSPPSGASIGFYRAAVNYSPTILFSLVILLSRNPRTLEILISQFPLNRYGTLLAGTGP